MKITTWSWSWAGTSKRCSPASPAHVVGERFDEYGYAMIVADGIGGAGGGERASRIALRRSCTWSSISANGI